MTPEQQSIHDRSVEAGKAFNAKYREIQADLRYSDPFDHPEVSRLLEEYKALRRQLPFDSFGNHLGYKEAYNATQGISND